MMMRAGVLLLTVLVAAFFFVAGATKLGMDHNQTSNFVRWGYPAWFQYVVGVVELGGALLLLVPRVAALGVLFLGVIMVGAALTHVVHGELDAAPVPLVLLALVSLVGYARWPLLRAWVRRGTPQAP